MKIDEINTINGQIKLDLINYFDTVKSEIDISALKVLDSIESLSNKSDVLNNVYKLNQEMIDIVNEIYENNAKCVNDFFRFSSTDDEMMRFPINKSIEEIKRAVFNGYCFYINGESLKKQFRDGNLLGLLITSDFYLDENQLNFLK